MWVGAGHRPRRPSLQSLLVLLEPTLVLNGDGSGSGSEQRAGLQRAAAKRAPE
jgi:hypothetical protein